MTIEELEEAIAERSRPYTQVFDHTPGTSTPGTPGKTAIEIADDILAGRHGTFSTDDVLRATVAADDVSTMAEPQHGLMIIRREPQECLPVSVVIVEDESTGCMQYMRRDADGHLGALDT